MELHEKVPPERWCVTQRDFRNFVREVRALWDSGQLGASDEGNPFHNDANHGPNLYCVNERFVKPVTLKAGGMSYALMKHPEGLPCDVFISHAWAEGLFELAQLVQNGWPRGQGLNYMYLCLLANPQNAYSWLENIPLRQTPFAQALQRSSHVLVIPNKCCSIYSRLWCVYEAYLGTEFQKTVLMPTKPPLRQLLRAALPTMVLPCLMGLAIGGFSIQERHQPHVLMGFGLTCGFTMLAALTYAATSSPMCSRLRYWTRSTCLRPIHATLILLDCAVMLPWLRMPHNAFSQWDSFLHYFVPFAILIFNVCLVGQLNQYALEMRELQRRAGQLDFVTLSSASCSCREDEVRIRQAIAGHEEEVDTAIRVLMKAGAYNDALRRSYAAGADISGWATRDIFMKTLLVAILWFMSMLNTCAAAEVQELCEKTWAWLLWSAGAISAVTTLALPLLIWRLHARGPHRVLAAVRVWLLLAILVVGIPLTLQIGNHLINGMHFLDLRRRELHRCPSLSTRVMLVVFRPLLAGFAFVHAAFGAFWPMNRGQGNVPSTSESESVSD